MNCPTLPAPAIATFMPRSPWSSLIGLDPLVAAHLLLLAGGQDHRAELLQPVAVDGQVELVVLLQDLLAVRDLGLSEPVDRNHPAVPLVLQVADRPAHPRVGQDH